MKRNRPPDEQVITILQEAAATTVVAASRKHGITEQSIYRWRRLYDGMQVSDVKEFRHLRDENLRLKRLLAERDLEVEVMKEIQRKKW
jgi:putative transposase